MRKLGCGFVLALFFAWMAFMFTGCDAVNGPLNKLDISARYQDLENGMILLLEHTDKSVSATLEWQGVSTELSGKFDAVSSQLIMSGNYFGSYNISFNLFYRDRILSGGYIFNNSGTKAVSFKYVNKLLKHDQGGG